MFTSRLVRAFNVVRMDIVYLQQTYLLTLESVSWNNNLEYPLGHQGCCTEFVWGSFGNQRRRGKEVQECQMKEILSCKQWGVMKGVSIVYIMCSLAVLSRMVGGDG